MRDNSFLCWCRPASKKNPAASARRTPGTLRCNAALAGARGRTTPRTPSTDTAAPAAHDAAVGLALRKDLLDRERGPREGLASQAGQVSEGSLPLSGNEVFSPRGRSRWRTNGSRGSTARSRSSRSRSSQRVSSRRLRTCSSECEARESFPGPRPSVRTSSSRSRWRPVGCLQSSQSRSSELPRSPRSGSTPWRSSSRESTSRGSKSMKRPSDESATHPAVKRAQER
jgi:hypothetical protein